MVQEPVYDVILIAKRENGESKLFAAKATEREIEGIISRVRKGQTVQAIILGEIAESDKQLSFPWC